MTDINKTIELGAGSIDARGANGASHGEQGVGDWAHARWCAAHGWHGFLYVCPMYATDLSNRVKQEAANWKTNLANDDWCAEQIVRGVSPRLLAMYRRLLHVKDWTESDNLPTTFQ